MPGIPQFYCLGTMKFRVRGLRNNRSGYDSSLTVVGRSFLGQFWHVLRTNASQLRAVVLCQEGAFGVKWPGS